MIIKDGVTINNPIKYENYLWGNVFMSNMVAVSIYGIGFMLILKFSLFIALTYLVYIMALEYRLLRHHCVNCYYWGKRCGFGKGTISSFLFKKGDSSSFCNKKMQWRDMLPDLLVPFTPLILGIVMIIQEFDIILLVGLILLIALSTFGNEFIRGSLTCNHCKQQELGCPAFMLFQKKEE